MRDMTNDGPIPCVSLRRCKRTPKLYPFGYSFGVPRMGGFETCQTRHIGVFDVSWKGRKVLFGDGFVIMRMREGRGEARGGSRHIKHAVLACLTCLEGREGAEHQKRAVLGAFLVFGTKGVTEHKGHAYQGMSFVFWRGHGCSGCRSQ